MSQGKSSGVATIPDSNDDRLPDHRASIASLCDEVVDTITMANSPDRAFSQAEAGEASEGDIHAACPREDSIIDRLERLARVIPQRSAASDFELAAKNRALDAFASVAAWDSGSLHVLRLSIERDRDQLGRTSRNLALPSSSQRNWLARRLRAYGRVLGS